MTLKNIVNAMVAVALGLLLGLVSFLAAPKASPELHIIIAVIAYFAIELSLKITDGKNEILHAINPEYGVKEGGCKHE